MKIHCLYPIIAVCALLHSATAVRAQDEMPAPSAGEAPPPPPPPPLDLMQMPIDVTPSPQGQGPNSPNGPNAPGQQPGLAQLPSAPDQPAASAAATRTPPPPPNATPPTGRYRNQQRGANNYNNALNSPAPRSDARSTPSSPTPLPVPSPAAPGTALRLNFQNASLTDVLNYLSAAAGFIITQETPVQGTVNVVSQQPISVDEAVDLLSSILSEKGYAVIRNGRILKIVSLQDAPKRGDMPVNVGQDPQSIPRKDNMVTQIIPVRYAEVGKLVDNLRPLLSNSATISSNDSSNAIILTDTQTNIHRLAEIIHALDTSISGISQIKVFTLRYSDAKGLADVLTQLFSPTQQQNNNLPPQIQAFMNRMNNGGRGGPGGGAPGGAPESEARQAAARVVAVADQTSNSVIVAAPDEVMSNVADIIAQLDTSTSDITETQIFRLLHADATELAGVLSSLYADTGTTTNANNNNNNRGNNNQPGRLQGQNNNGSAGMSARALAQTRVVAVADARTNSVLISASHDTMAQIGLMIGRLDSSGAKKQHVYVYTLNHADPDNLATILRGMYTTSNNGTSSTATQPSISALPNRTTTGVSSDVSSTINTNSSSSRTSGR